MWVSSFGRDFRVIMATFINLGALSNESETYTRGKLTCPEH